MSARGASRGRYAAAGLAAAALAMLPGWPLGAATPALKPGEPVRVEIPEDPFAGLAERFRRLARRDERNKDWHRAVMRWQAVASMEPGDQQARRRIAGIKAMLRRNAQRHFRLARKHLQNKSYARAFREFLRTLSYDPTNRMALAMVKHDLNARSLKDYKVRRGDTIREIAAAEYNDPKMVFLINYYNDISDPRKLNAGAVLQLPVMAGVMPRPRRPEVRVARAAKPKPKARAKPKRRPKASPKPPAEEEAPAREEAPAGKAVARKEAPPEEAPRKEQDTGEQPAAAAPSEAAPSGAGGGLAAFARVGESAGASIVREEVRQQDAPEVEYDDKASRAKYREAKRLYDNQQFEAAAAAAEAVLEEDPAHNEARELVNAAYYARGQELRAQQDYIAAMQVLTRVDPGYKDVQEVLSSTRGRVKGQEAEMHYIAGVTYFLEEDLDAAIREWEKVLEIEPEHPQARKDLQNAKALRDKLAQVQ